MQMNALAALMPQLHSYSENSLHLSPNTSFHIQLYHIFILQWISNFAMLTGTTVHMEAGEMLHWTVHR